VKYSYRATHFQTRHDIGASVQHQDPAVFPPRKAQGTQIYRRMDGPQVRFGRAWRRENLLQTAGF